MNKYRIEKELIEILKFHEQERETTTEKILNKEGSSDHLNYIYAYEDGSIQAIKDCLDIIRKWS